MIHLAPTGPIGISPVQRVETPFDKKKIVIEVISGEEMGSGLFDLFGWKKMTSLTR